MIKRPFTTLENVDQGFDKTDVAQLLNLQFKSTIHFTQPEISYNKPIKIYSLQFKPFAVLIAMMV